MPTAAEGQENGIRLN